jgi:hypothetical protein
VRAPESTRSDVEPPVSPMIASNACQMAIAIMPIAITTRSVLPRPLPASVCSAPDWSLSCDEPRNATCSAIHAKIRWMMP